MSAPLRVQLVDGPSGFASLANECDDLARRMQPRLPFATSCWLGLWWKHYCEDRLWVRDTFLLHTVRDEHGALLALAPLMLTERPGAGPLRTRALTFFGGDKNVTELRGLVCAPQAEGAVARALLAHVAEQGEEWDWFLWNGVRKDSEAYSVLTQAGHFEWTGENVDYVLPLPTTWQEFRGSRSRNIKESLRKCYNSLKRDGHSFKFRVVSEAAEMPAALSRFFALHACRARSPTQIHHQDVFSTTRARQLVRDVAANPSSTLSVRVFELEIAGNVVASRLGFVLGDELYLYFSGYEPSWGGYSVMTTTVAESIKWAIDNRFRLVNLSPGTDISKTRWGATPITTVNGVLLSPTRRGKWVFRVAAELNERSRSGTLLGKVVDRARRLG